VSRRDGTATALGATLRTTVDHPGCGEEINADFSRLENLVRHMEPIHRLQQPPGLSDDGQDGQVWRWPGRRPGVVAAAG
jgi:hypothetical protein